MRVLLDSGCGGVLVNRSFVKNTKKPPCQNPPIGLLRQFEDEIFSMHDPTTTDAARIQEIMDVKYAPADINEMVSKCDHLTNTERSDLKMLLHKFESLFDGTLGT
jgi:hypothetical protein